MKPEDIKKLRTKIGVTQEKFAQILGTTHHSVNRWEKGAVVPSRLYKRELRELWEDSEAYLHRQKKFK